MPEVNGELIEFNPARSSVSASIIPEDLGFDVHAISAYIIARRGPNKLLRS